MDRPLTKHHGFPARALVPGWIGSASCKWLTEIKVLEAEFVGNFMNPGYRLPNQPVKPGETREARRYASGNCIECEIGNCGAERRR